MIRLRLTALILGVAMLAGAAMAEEPAKQGLAFSGSLYTDVGVYHYLRDSACFSGTTVLAARFINVNRTRAKAEGDIEVILPYGAAADDDTAASGYYELSGRGAPLLLLDIRKLYLEVYLPYADIALGRQIINFGKGLIFSV